MQYGDGLRFRSLGIRVGHTPDVLTDSVAEHAMCLILMTLLRVKEQMR